MVVTQTNHYSERPFLARGTDDERSQTALPGTSRQAEHWELPTRGPCGPNHPHRTTTAARHDARLAWRVRMLPSAEGMRMPGTTELSNEDLQTVLGLIKDADSVELKLTIHESARA
jgi:hypothetical protein